MPPDSIQVANAMLARTHTVYEQTVPVFRRGQSSAVLCGITKLCMELRELRQNRRLYLDRERQFTPTVNARIHRFTSNRRSDTQRGRDFGPSNGSLRPNLSIRSISLALLVTTAALTGCASGGTRTSTRATLLAFHSAAQRQDYAALYAMLPERARREETLAQFSARLGTERVELTALSTGVQNAMSAGRNPSLAVPTRGSGSVTVVEDEAGWRMGRAHFGPVISTPTALDAARALRDALARRSLDGVLAILSSRARGSMQSEMGLLLDALADPASLEARPSSAGANGAEGLMLRLPDGRSLLIVREGSNWRIDDIQ